MNTQLTLKKFLFYFFIFTIGGCLLLVAISFGCCYCIRVNDQKHVLSAYSGENEYYKFYTFKAKVRSIRIAAHPQHEWEKFYEFDVDYEYFEQHYRDDNDTFTFEDGLKRWEAAYEGFNHYEFMLIEDNYEVLAKTGGYDLLVEGTEVILTANNYFGWNGWMYPILELKVGDNTYLDFETGKENYINLVNSWI